MKIKLRGKDFDFINDFMEGKDVDILVGKDINGNEVYTGDTVIDVSNGGEYQVAMNIDLHFLPFESNISNFKLKE